LTATPIIPIVNGGMGAATAVAAIVALLPAQTSLFNGYVLSTNGTLASWNAASTGAVTRLHQNPFRPARLPAPPLQRSHSAKSLYRSASPAIRLLGVGGCCTRLFNGALRCYLG
jgi:hypothetical protein